MKYPQPTKEQVAGREYLQSLITNNVIEKKELKLRGFSTDNKRRIPSEHFFRFTDSRQIDGCYRQDSGEILVVVCAFGWLWTYYVLSQDEFNKARSVQTPTENYYEF